MIYTFVFYVKLWVKLNAILIISNEFKASGNFIHLYWTNILLSEPEIDERSDEMS